MSSSKVLHFSEENSQFPKVFLESEVYSQALDSLVIACVDVVLLWGDRILLGKRRNPPRPEWWVIGGRMHHGESPVEAAQRKLREEAGLMDIEGDRLKFIGVFSTRFAERNQPPKSHGLHSVNLTYRLQLTDAEATAIQLDSAEYERSQWWTWAEIQTELQRGIPMDQALTQLLIQAQIAQGI